MMVQENLVVNVCVEFLAFQSLFWAKEVATPGWREECTLLTSALFSFDKHCMNIDFSKGKFMEELLDLILIDLPVNLAAVCSSLGKGFKEVMSKQAMHLCKRQSDQQALNKQDCQYTNLLRKFSLFCIEDPTARVKADGFCFRNPEAF